MAVILSALMLLAGCSSSGVTNNNSGTDAAERSLSEDKMNDTVPRLEYWSEGSETARSITDYVEAVTNEGSSEFIPEAERIAVFDIAA